MVKDPANTATIGLGLEIRHLGFRVPALSDPEAPLSVELDEARPTGSEGWLRPHSPLQDASPACWVWRVEGPKLTPLKASTFRHGGPEQPQALNPEPETLKPKP